MNDTAARFHAVIKGVEFVWHGGDFHSYDCIDVWGAERSLETFETRCREYANNTQ